MRRLRRVRPVGNAQILSRAGISFGGGTAEPLDVAKQVWLEDARMQPLRRHCEQMLVEKDWGKAMVALDVTDSWSTTCSTPSSTRPP